MKAFIIDRYNPAMGVGSPTCQNRCGPTARCWSTIHAAGVNLLDSKIRSGEFKRILPYRMPLISGNDLAGKVVRLGPEGAAGLAI